MSRKLTVHDYPEHLNPFDENYNGVAAPPDNRHKYNTWSSSRPNKISPLVKPRPTLLENPWKALNSKGKIGRRLSFLKTAVERFASKKHRLAHSASYTEGTLPSRSNSVHDDFAFRIISPKVKEKLRQQAFSSSLNKQELAKADSAEPSTPQVNGRVTLSLKLEGDDPSGSEDPSPTSPESGKDMSTLGARPKARKKRPPPPPPAETSKPNNLHQGTSEIS